MKTRSAVQIVTLDIQITACIILGGLYNISWAENILTFYMLIVFLLTILFTVGYLSDAISDKEMAGEVSNKYWRYYRRIIVGTQLLAYILLGWFMFAFIHSLFYVLIMALREVARDRIINEKMEIK